MSPGTLGGKIDLVTSIIIFEQYGQPVIPQSSRNDTVEIGSWVVIEIE